MIPMRHLRSNPYFAHLFARVHPLCWPILWWSLNWLFKWYDTSGYEEILFGTTRWGYVYVAYLGDRIPDPSVYRPYESGMARWDDPAWESDVPVNLATISISHEIAGIGSLSGSEMATSVPLPPNTS
jgi:hypothetical protein